MDPLPQIPYDLRVKWIEYLPTDRHTARAIEQHVHSNRQTILDISSGVDVYRYGNVDVLAIDSLDAHVQAASSHYTEQMRRAAWILHTKMLTTKEAIDALSCPVDELVAGTDHAKWEAEFFEQKERARGVLSGRSAPVSGIFACPKCKSFDVDTDQKQTRSADEPMTIFCCCNSCGSRFIR
jgi:DNA-directed RNA polymerase subunit M/transcription elongation factor TFIIS